MEDGGSKQPISKPPWDMIQFQQSMTPTQELWTALKQIQYDISWNEILHDEMNALKANIEPLEANHAWELLKKKTNLYELIYTQDGSTCPPSLTVLRPLSRSYFKMIEILQVAKFFDRLAKGTQKLRSVHVAEGPGGFIEAFLDKASNHRIPVSKVFAMTLKPTNNHIPGWRRAYNFLQKHPEIKISYGEDGTGNLYESANQESFVRLAEGQKAHLFTGDGGFDFSVNYEEQEKSVFLLLVASALIGLQVLLPEGMFVLKLFDLFSDTTQLLIRLISLCFKEWTLYKPATSRPCNSERYLVCRGFRKAYPEVLALLRIFHEKYTESKLYPHADFFSFFSEKEKEFLIAHMETLRTTQKDILEKTLALHTEDQSSFSWTPHYKAAQHWCTTFSVPTTGVHFPS